MESHFYLWLDISTLGIVQLDFGTTVLYGNVQGLYEFVLVQL